MSQIKLYLFGPPHLEYNGQPIEISLRKAFALLIYMAVTRQMHSRDALATLFWPEKEQPTARANLRRTLYDLNQLLGEPLLNAGPETIVLSGDVTVWLDVEEFRGMVSGTLAPHASREAEEDVTLRQLVAATELYADDFLTGFTLPDCPAFDDWQFFLCEELRRVLASVLQRLVHRYQTLGNVEEALHPARRLLQLDPLEETVQRQLMQLYAQAGQTAAALRQYEECVRTLDAELGVAPEDETTALYEAIRTKRFPVQDGRNESSVVRADGQKHHSVLILEGEVAQSRPHKFPTQTTPFVGRAHDLADIVRWLEDPACRLLTLIGPGGIGKTRLALEAARQLGEREAMLKTFVDGIYFVPLQAVSAASGLVAAIVRVLDFRFFNDYAERQQLLDALRNKQMLLILDNFEHLLQETDFIAELLAIAPTVKLLVTSREALTLQEAWFYPVAGMRFPKAEVGSGDTIDEYDAVRFFMQCVRAVKGTFSLATEHEHVARICRLVGGTPLAIELAVAWLKMLPCQQIADEIERSLDFLTARHQSVLVRHRSMRVVLEQTWQRLTAAEQEILSKLAVFRGGCARPAAEQVTGATLLRLTALMEKALLHLTGEGRYEIHELIRQFAEEQLHSVLGGQEEPQARHCVYYATFLQQQTPNLKGKRQKEAFVTIMADLANVRAAWQYAVAHNDVYALDCAAEGLWIFSDSSGAFHEGEAAFHQAVTTLTAQRSAKELPEEQKTLVGFLLAGQGHLCFRRGDLKRGRSLIEEGVILLRQAEFFAGRKLAIALLYWGWSMASRTEHEQAQHLAQESLAIFTKAEDQWGLAACMELQSRLAILSRPLDEALRLLQEGLTVSMALEAHKLCGGFLHKMGEVALWRGDYTHAQQWLEEARTVAQELGTLPGLIYILRDLGKLAIYQGYPDLALQIVERGFAIAQEIEPQWIRRSMLNVLAEAQRLLGNDAEAERQYQAHLQAARAGNSLAAIASSLSGLGLLAFTQGDLARAEQLLQEALALWQQLGPEAEAASVLCRLGHVFAADGEKRIQEARRRYGEALQLAFTHGLAPVALDVFVGVAQLDIRAGNLQRGSKLLELAVHHDASTYETKMKAQLQLAELSAHISHAQRTHTPHTQSHESDWQITVQRLVEELRTSVGENQALVPHNLPPQPTQFVGRMHELHEIVRCLRMPACRLLTIVGPGGIGKTRIALQAALRIVDDEREHWEKRGLSAETASAEIDAGESSLSIFTDGVFFVPLQPVSAASGLIAAIAEATGFHFYSDTPPTQQLVTFLRDKKMLLILDNMEHLPEGASLVSELLAKAPTIKLLVTSQQSLYLHEEWFHPLAGMTLPRRNHPASHLIAPGNEKSGDLHTDAVQFFVQCALHARADFVLDIERDQVVRICQLVDGMPLAIELAAAWLKVLSCQQIADEIERGLDILTARHQNVPVRHRSMHAVLEQSWQQLLDSAEEAVFKRLSIFRGGFTLEAALDVVDASFMALAGLVEKALLWLTPNGRYQMHELLRQFAHKQLASNLQEESTIRRRHSVYYLRLLSTRAPLLISKTRRVTVEEMGQESENLRLAWDWAVQQLDLEFLNQAIEPLYHFYQIQSRYQEGKDLFSRAWASLQESPAPREESLKNDVSVRILARSGAFCYFLCEYDAASQSLQECIRLAQSLDQRREVAFVLNLLGQLAVWRGEQERATEYLLQSLAISRELGDTSGAASALDKLANFTHATFGEYAESKQLAAQSLALSRELGRLDWVASALDTLGYITFCLGEYDEAAIYYRESLAHFESLDDHYGIAMALGGIGLVLWAMGGDNNVEATANLQKSLLICRTIGHQGQVVGRLAGLARIANDLGEYEQAQQVASEALPIARELGSPIYLAHLLNCLGESAYAMGDLPTARVYLLEALRVTSETGLLAYLAIALFHYAVLLIKEIGSDVTLSTYKQGQALELLALVQNHPATWQVYKKRARERFADLAMELPDSTVAAAKTRAERQTLQQAMEILGKAE